MARYKIKLDLPRLHYCRPTCYHCADGRAQNYFGPPEILTRHCAYPCLFPGKGVQWSDYFPLHIANLNKIRLQKSGGLFLDQKRIQIADW